MFRLDLGKIRPAEESTLHDASRWRLCADEIHRSMNSAKAQGRSNNPPKSSHTCVTTLCRVFLRDQCDA
jgi:hypothetical protein